ncbi:phage/plasmid primase, P4 family [Acuticoccus sediminis]|uniref:phage/plasmid primase, P4 family n=1 Tax=Acuticoccus sediminis TaxID=2184697 RepID=UPI001CFCDEFE|nr:phage/plasmid primase, P4 family [Acuticoccus sediminis]
MTILDAALALAKRGWPVFPCNPEADKVKGSKRPLTEHGLKDASTDAGTIRGWWGRWPEALIGLPTGPGLGAFVVDLDPREKSCSELWDELEALIGAPLGEPIVAVTQSGGWHLYYAWPDLGPGEKLGNRSGKRSGLPAHVDVRGEGGYVIAPPSVMLDGRRYEWRSGPTRGLTAAPAELIDCILRRGRFAKEEEPARPRGAPVETSERVRKYALAALDAEVRKAAAAPNGERNETLNATAYALGQLVGAGALSESVVVAALDDVAAQWPNRKKSRGTIQSGLRAGIASPRDLSEVEAGRTRSPDEWRSRGSQIPPPGDDGGDGGDEPPGGGVIPGGDDGGRLDRTKLERCAALEGNDTGNGHRLLEWFGDHILHVRDIGWAVWDGKRWCHKGGEEAANRLAQETARRIPFEVPLIKIDDDERAAMEARGESKEAIDKAEKQRRASRLRHALQSGNSGKLAGMIGVAATHATVDVDQLDAEPLAINVQNGTLRLVEAIDPECPDPDVERKVWSIRLDPHNQRDRISKITSAAYDPSARCPGWDAFCKRFLPDAKIRWWMQRWAGYAMTGLTGEQMLVFNYGRGANGKSTFCAVLQKLMDEYAAPLPAEAVTGEQTRRSDQATPEWARLPGVRMVLIGELPRDQPLKEETIKLVTGGERMLVRHLNEGFIEMKPTFKAVMAGNHKPRATGSDYAVWRRMRLVPWTETLAEEERRPMDDLLEEFQAEASGILNWAMEGLLGYLNEGLKPPSGIVEATEEYRAEMDPVGEFLKACVVAKPGNEVEARAFYGAYLAWSEANGMRPLSETRFAKEMSYTTIKKQNGRIRKYLDVILQDVPMVSDVADAPLV